MVGEKDLVPEGVDTKAKGSTYVTTYRTAEQTLLVATVQCVHVTFLNVVLQSTARISLLNI